MTPPTQLRPAPELVDTDRAPLRICMVAPPYFALPPVGYGGIEAVVADLVDGLVDLGHDVTLVGAGRHSTKAQHFIATFDEPPSDKLGDPLAEVLHAARVAEVLDSGQFDIVHDHTLAGPLLARSTVPPTVVTAHGPLGGDIGDYFRALGRTTRFVAISDAQRRAAPELPWLATVHNGIRVDTFPFQEEKEDFALFLGRYHPEKAPHLAIDAARAAGLPIVLAGKCQEPLEQEYFDTHITPRLGPDVTAQGIADATQKRDLLRRARCLLFPICWEEPFGLVMTEAMACGTPVVALRRGSVPEIVVDDVTGITVTDPDGLPDAIERAREIKARACRDHVEANFSDSVMALRYERAYRKLLDDLREPRLSKVPQRDDGLDAACA